MCVSRLLSPPRRPIMLVSISATRLSTRITSALEDFTFVQLLSIRPPSVSPPPSYPLGSISAARLSALPPLRSKSLPSVQTPQHPAANTAYRIAFVCKASSMFA